MWFSCAQKTLKLCSSQLISRKTPAVLKTPKLMKSSSTAPDAPYQSAVTLNPRLVQCFLNHGFPVETCEQILSQLPQTQMNENKLDHSLNSWEACQFGQAKLVNLLTANPDLVLAEHRRIINCFKFLSSYFTHEYVYKILINAPSVIYQKESATSSKLEFLNKQMGVPNNQIVNSSALDHPLDHLRTRYEFLKRCGVYTKVEKGSTTVASNPEVYDMFDTSDEHFAERVAHLTPLEFEAFTQLFSLESEYDEDLDSDED